LHSFDKEVKITKNIFLITKRYNKLKFTHHYDKHKNNQKNGANDNFFITLFAFAQKLTVLPLYLG
jgi:hypothetical protein